jgi:hypothetical protein
MPPGPTDPLAPELGMKELHQLVEQMPGSPRREQALVALAAGDLDEVRRLVAEDQRWRRFVWVDGDVSITLPEESGDGDQGL